ncbi:MAG: hypothetical protein H5T86_09945 [Armatimonadetes bacterium]|nr:hypothetical protein [Armatimonadota bacterium]
MPVEYDGLEPKDVLARMYQDYGCILVGVVRESGAQGHQADGQHEGDAQERPGILLLSDPEIGQTMTAGQEVIVLSVDPPPFASA